MNLAELKPGKQGTIIELDKNSTFKTKVSSLGIRIGKKVKVLSKQPFKGPMIIEIDNMKAALGRNMAKKIILETE
ncbi:MAG: FeoA family protein [Candidatus Woesearchaeota archaeon]|jgi:ferrous iron transport protein A|nr:FeoA family protein [Candidatus Woesearchaeota archaeon]